MVSGLGSKHPQALMRQRAEGKGEDCWQKEIQTACGGKKQQFIRKQEEKQL